MYFTFISKINIQLNTKIESLNDKILLNLPNAENVETWLKHQNAGAGAGSWGEEEWSSCRSGEQREAHCNSPTDDRRSRR